MFLDVKKAFDSVNHKILLKKLYYCGLRGKMYDLLKSYLSKRTQIVKLKNSVSTSLDVTHGVPQGTVLGPLLFIIYINGLLNINVDAEIICYADDTAILVHSSSTESLNIKANNVIKEIKDWFDNNLLELNLNKSKYIHFNINSVVNSPELNICIHSFKCQSGICENCVILENSNYIKYLGLTLDSKFKWNYHINILTNTIRKFFYVFHDLRHIFNTDMKRIIYLALVQSILCYGIVFWGQAYESHIHSLNITLNNVITFIFNLPRLTNNEFVYNVFNLLNIRCLYYKNLLLTYHNFKNNRYCSY